MHTPQIRAYVPESLTAVGKEETVFCRRFTNDFALVDPDADYTALCARGLHLKPRHRLILEQEEEAFLLASLTSSSTVAVMSDLGILLVFGHLLNGTPLLPVLLPHGKPASIAEALGHIPRKELHLSPAVKAAAKRSPELYDTYEALTEDFALIDRFLQPPPRFDFRLLCAHIADFTGCRINVTSFPAGHFPIAASDRSRWIAFCLCMLILLRGDSADGPQLLLECATRREIHPLMEQHSEYVRPIPVANEIIPYLERPCFKDFSITPIDGGFQVHASLRKALDTSALHATDHLSDDRLLLTVTFPA